MGLAMMDYDLLSDLQGMPYRVFGAAFAVRRNKGMKDVAVFGDQPIAGIKCLSKNVAG